MHRKRLAAVVDTSVWKKWPKGRLEYRIVEEVWNQIKGSQDEILSVGEGEGYRTKVRHAAEIGG